MSIDITKAREEIAVISAAHSYLSTLLGYEPSQEMRNNVGEQEVELAKRWWILSRNLLPEALDEVERLRKAYDHVGQALRGEIDDAPTGPGLVRAAVGLRAERDEALAEAHESRKHLCPAIVSEGMALLRWKRRAEGAEAMLAMESEIRGDGLAADLGAAVLRADRAEAAHRALTEALRRFADNHVEGYVVNVDQVDAILEQHGAK